jgi:hypothetical protein
VIDDEFKKLSTLIDSGNFQKAYEDTLKLLNKTKNQANKDLIYYRGLFNISGLLIDLGSMQRNDEAAKVGIDLIENNKEELLQIIGESAYYYNLANAKSNLIKIENTFDVNFTTIEQLVELKNLHWKSIKSSKDNSENIPEESIVNLGTALKRQFRVVEALQQYDSVNELEKDIPQSWINRSETLMMLNTISGSYSIQLLKEVKLGYENVISSNQIPPMWKKYYKEQIDNHTIHIVKVCQEHNVKKDEYDKKHTEEEYENHSNFRKFCLQKNLVLSEHGLYCKCVASTTDDLSILTNSRVTNNSSIPMEMVLNRLKSEFSLSRRLYYEYLSEDKSYELLHESCFSELFIGELLGVEMEKLRTSFRLCFGILDKIGVAICELYDVYPKNRNIYFQSFWQLDSDGRREQFEAIKTPGLLALYSIATDLNEYKNGELSFFKQYRNDLEHKFVIIHESKNPDNIYATYGYFKDIVYIQEAEFTKHLELLFQLTRSAIFSFVFTVREHDSFDENTEIVL